MENFLLGRRYSTEQELAQANELIEAIGRLSQNYFWANDIPAQGQRVGILMFKQPQLPPPQVYLLVGDNYAGVTLRQTEGGNKTTP